LYLKSHKVSTKISRRPDVRPASPSLNVGKLLCATRHFPKDTPRISRDQKL
jgi:hypothetical protein